MGAGFCKGIFCIYWDGHMAFIFQFLMWYITLTDLCILKNPCTPKVNPTWSWWMIFLMHCWILFARILLRIFASTIISDIGLWFSFFVMSLSDFVSGQSWLHRINIMCSFSGMFFQSFRSVGISSSLNVQ